MVVTHALGCDISLSLSLSLSISLSLSLQGVCDGEKDQQLGAPEVASKGSHRQFALLLLLHLSLSLSLSLHACLSLSLSVSLSLSILYLPLSPLSPLTGLNFVDGDINDYSTILKAIPKGLNVFVHGMAREREREIYIYIYIYRERAT